jgi:hypothetical protein
MEDSLTWLTAALVFIGIIVQQDAQGAVSRPLPMIEAGQQAQHPAARFLTPLQGASHCQGVSRLGFRDEGQHCVGNGIYLCANAPLIGLDGPVRACVPGSDQHARLPKTSKEQQRKSS